MSIQPINIAALVLAAGESVRLGTPKQLLSWNSKTLLQKTISELQHIQLPFPYTLHTTVVLGAYYEQIVQTISGIGVNIIRNRQWQLGMGESLQCGIKFITQQYQPDYILIALCDQPLVTSAHYGKLLAECIECGKGITASFYNYNFGVPVVFGKQYFSTLCALQRNKGAQSTIQQNVHDVQGVDIPEAAFDIDTMDDYHVLYHK